MAKATQTVTSTVKKTVVKIKPKSTSGQKRCPTCGKFMGGGSK